MCVEKLSNAQLDLLLDALAVPDNSTEMLTRVAAKAEATAKAEGKPLTPQLKSLKAFLAKSK